MIARLFVLRRRERVAVVVVVVEEARHQLTVEQAAHAPALRRCAGLMVTSAASAAAIAES